MQPDVHTLDALPFSELISKDGRRFSMRAYRLPILLILTFLLLLTGCQPYQGSGVTEPEQVSLSTPTPLPTVVSTATSVGNEVNTSTHLPLEITPSAAATPTPPAEQPEMPVVTVTVTPTQTLLAPFSLQVNCAVDSGSLTGSFLSEGALVFYRIDARGISVLNAQQPLPLLLVPKRSFASVSPYSGTIAWLDSGRVRFKHSSGQETEAPWDGQTIPWQWLPDDRVIMRNTDDRDFDTHSAQDTFYVISARTGETEMFHYEFWGNFGYSHSYISTGGRGSLMYNPDLSLALYSYVDPESRDEGFLL
jgi:hypothetical protein